MTRYQQLKDTIANHSPENVFFAFSEQQYKEGMQKKNIPPDAKILAAPMNMYGTQDGIDNFFKFIDDVSEQISKECEPQDVYDYEYVNHECSIVYDDHEAIEIVVNYFGADRARQVKRKNAHIKI